MSYLNTLFPGSGSQFVQNQWEVEVKEKYEEEVKEQALPFDVIKAALAHLNPVALSSPALSEKVSRVLTDLNNNNLSILKQLPTFEVFKEIFYALLNTGNVDKVFDKAIEMVNSIPSTEKEFISEVVRAIFEAFMDTDNYEQAVKFHDIYFPPSLAPSNFLFKIPQDHLDRIVSYCELPDILCLESTFRRAHQAIKNIWLTLMINRNLFFQSPQVLAKSTDKIKKILLTGNRKILTLLLPHICSQALPIPISIAQTTQVSTSQANPFLRSQAQNSPWKRIYLQVMIQDKKAIKIRSPYNSSNITSKMHYAANVFTMLDEALERNQTELFTLLEHYSFFYTTDRSKYLQLSNLLVINEIKRSRPSVLKHLCTVLTTVGNKKSVSDVHHSSISQDGRKEVGEIMTQSIINMEFSDSGILHLPYIYDGNTPLKNAIDQVYKYVEKSFFRQQILMKSIKSIKKESIKQRNLMQSYRQDDTTKEGTIEDSSSSSEWDSDSDSAPITPREKIIQGQIQTIIQGKITRLDVVKVLIAAKANVDKPGIMSCMADESNTLPDLDILNVLIEGKANVNQSKEGHTLLERALETLPDRKRATLQTTHDIIFALLNAKADVNGQNLMHQTPLMVAIATQKCTGKIFKLLLQQGPDFTLSDTEGNTALMYAVRKPGNTATIKLLLASRKLPGIPQGKKRTVRMSEADINHVDLEGHTALSRAILLNHSETESYVKLLLQAGADAALIPQNLNIPDHIALLLCAAQPNIPAKKGVKKRKTNEE